MTSLQKLFSIKNKNVLNIYFTAGYPTLTDTLPLMEALQNSGVDIIELGMPFSDPLADGETIQLSSKAALDNGMTILILLEQLKDCRKKINVPIVLMGYLNPLVQYGFEKFCAAINAIGIDALIIPDLPVIEFEEHYGNILKKYNIDFVFLITPQTPVERIKKLDALSTGFLYAVSSNTTTGSATNLNEVSTYLQKLRLMQLKNPVLTGFGIHDKNGFQEVCKYTNGGIIGSAFIKKLSNNQNAIEIAKTFVKSIIQ